MNKIKIMKLAMDHLQHPNMMRDWVDYVWPLKSKGSSRNWHQRRTSHGITARKQNNFVPLLYQFIGQVRNHSFGASIKFWRDALIQRRNLCNLHKKMYLDFYRLDFPNWSLECCPQSGDDISSPARGGIIMRIRPLLTPTQEGLTLTSRLKPRFVSASLPQVSAQKSNPSFKQPVHFPAQ